MDIVGDIWAMLGQNSDRKAETHIYGQIHINIIG